MKKNLDKIIILLILAWNLLLFFKLPHVSWIPGFIGAWFMEKKLILYRDILQTHFPFTQFLLWPLFKISNWALWIEPFLALLITIGTSFYIYFKTNKWLSIKARIVSLFFYLSYVWYFVTQIQFCEELLLGLFTLVIFIETINSFFKKLGNKNLFLLGILFSVTLLTGQIVIPLLLALFFVNLYLYKKDIYILIVGMTIPVIIISIYYWFNNSLYDFYFWNIEYYLTYAKLLSKKEEILPWLDIIFFSLPAILLLPKGKKNIASSLIGLSSIPLIVFSIFHPHHFLYSLPILAVCLGMATKNGKIVKVYIFFFIIYFTIHLWPWYTGRFINTGKIVNLTDVKNDKNQLETISWLKNNSKNVDKIIVVGDPMFYFRSDRLPANKYYSVLPWHYQPLEITKKEFEKKKPHFWIIDKSYKHRLISGWKTPDIVDFVNQELYIYQMVYENPEWEIWRIKT